MLDLYTHCVVSLYHQTSDKRLLRTNGKGIKSLTGFKNWSLRSLDLHSEKSWSWNRRLAFRFVNKQICCQRFIKMLIQEGDWLEETSVSKNQQKQKIVFG